MDQLAQKGIVGPDLGGGRGREVLLKRREEGEQNTHGDDLFPPE